MRPRYKVVVDFPFSPWQVGDIVTPNENGAVEYDYMHLVPSRYPDCFAPLDWYSERNLESLIVTDIRTGHIMEATRQDLANGYVITEETHWNKWPLSGFLPATEAEYLAYKNQVR